MEDLNVFSITAAIADPTRLSVMMHLIHGEASVNEMICQLDVSQSNLSNHLAVLKNAGLIKSTSTGRQKIYEIANPESAQLIELLSNFQRISPQQQTSVKPIQFARTCYDHLAGKLGVAVFNALVQKKAIKYPHGVMIKEREFFSIELAVGTNGKNIFSAIGVDLSSLTNTRRRFAFACKDWTEKAPHLAGALGAATCHAFLEKKWIVRKPSTRAVVLTANGRQALKNLIGLEIPGNA
jgi:DNA-binding transcriptional ArsR family regulator